MCHAHASQTIGVRDNKQTDASVWALGSVFEICVLSSANERRLADQTSAKDGRVDSGRPSPVWGTSDMTAVLLLLLLLLRGSSARRQDADTRWRDTSGLASTFGEVRVAGPAALIAIFCPTLQALLGKGQQQADRRFF